MSEEQESAQIEEEPIIFQEQEVLWAKIRGYPWWPAFVDKVHNADAQNPDDIEYTVNFFGDNTHSRLQGSKLRRYVDHYTEFYPKIKTHRKLHQSILRAEEKMRQNGVNTDIFQSLKGGTKKSRRGRGGHHYRTESRISSQDANLINSEVPELNRNSTFNHNENKDEDKGCGQSLHNSMSIEKPAPRRRGRKPKRLIEQEREKSRIQNGPKQSENEKQDLQSQEVKNSNRQLTRSRRGIREVSYKNDEMKSESDSSGNEQLSDEMDSDSERLPPESKSIKGYPLRQKHKTKSISRGVGKRRGRPKKINHDSKSEEILDGEDIDEENSHVRIIERKDDSKNHEQKMDEEQSLGEISMSKPKGQQPLKTKQRFSRSKPVFEGSITDEKMQRQPRSISNRNTENENFSESENKSFLVYLEEREEKAKAQPHPNRELILERIKFCLDKREELIAYLDELNITTSIVKEILDLDVTTIILNGEITSEMIRVIQKLKAAVLHRYFPQDIKMRKKYDKITKKAMTKAVSVETNEESLEVLELRKKTISKLEKIMKGLETQDTNLKQKAIEIEAHFRKYDEEIGNPYKTIAYKVLRSLKDKSDSIDEVMAKLQKGEFEEQK